MVLPFYRPKGSPLKIQERERKKTMLATTEKMFRMHTSLSECEKESLMEVELILNFLQEMLELEHIEEITSADTGEVIDVDEIARARGILDGILHSEAWEVMF